MTDERTPVRLDVTTPNCARMYDYFLGGKDNFAADRAAAEVVLRIAPHTPLVAMSNRAFLGRAVRHLASEAGIRQFIDIGAGLPTQANVHEVAQRAAPDAKVIYVDNDPFVLAHSRALLSGDDNTITVAGDLRRPAEILSDSRLRQFVDLGRPTAVLLLAVLHFLNDDDFPGEAVATLRDMLAPGSHLVISHVTSGDRPEVVEQGVALYQQVNSGVTVRGRERILSFFDGLELLEPGLVPLNTWRPDAFAGERASTADVIDAADVADLAGGTMPDWFLCGVGRKP